MQNVQWLFFDLGSTLIDETDALARRVRETISGTNVRLKDFMRVCNARYAEGLDGYKTAVGTFHLSIAPWHSDEERPYHDAASTLQALQSRGYRLGVIANQLPGTEQRLKHWGFSRFSTSWPLPRNADMQSRIRRSFSMRCGGQDARRKTPS